MARDGAIRKRGKTERDRRSGAMARNRANKLARADWERSKAGTKFPAETCNGKKNRRKEKKA